MVWVVWRNAGGERSFSGCDGEELKMITVVFMLTVRNRSDNGKDCSICERNDRKTGNCGED